MIKTSKILWVRVAGSGWEWLEWGRVAGSGWEWVRVAGSGWEWMRVAGSGWVCKMVKPVYLMHSGLLFPIFFSFIWLFVPICSISELPLSFSLCECPDNTRYDKRHDIEGSNFCLFPEAKGNSMSYSCKVHF